MLRARLGNVHRGVKALTLVSAMILAGPAATLELSTVPDTKNQPLLRVTLPAAGWGPEGRVAAVGGGFAVVAGSGVYPLSPHAAKPSRDFASVVPVAADRFVAVDRFETSYSWPYPLGRLVLGRFDTEGLGGQRVLALPDRERVSLMAAAEHDGAQWVAYTSQDRRGRLRLASFPSPDAAVVAVDLADAVEVGDALRLLVDDTRARLLTARRDARTGCRARLRLERFDRRSLASLGMVDACIEGPSTFAQTLRIHAAVVDGDPVWFVVAADGGRLDVWTVREAAGELVVKPAASVEGVQWSTAQGAVDSLGGLVMVASRAPDAGGVSVLRVSRAGDASSSELRADCPDAPETGGRTRGLVGLDGQDLVLTSRATGGGLCMNVWKL
jgi:hypothetical protein